MKSIVIQALAIFLSIFTSSKAIASSLTSGNPPDSLENVPGYVQ